MASSTSSFLFKLATFTLCLGILFGTSSGQLTAKFYARTCPNFRSVVTKAVNSAVSSEARMGASLLRLHFHDCFVNATRDSVVALGGPGWNLVFGRRDSTTANSNLSVGSSSLSGLIAAYSSQNLSTNEMVALSGAHTIGQARCTIFRSRLANDNNINASFVTTTRANCPTSGGDNNLSPLDATPTRFDNMYYNDLINQRGLLHTDQELFNGGSTDALVRTYASNQATFFRDFASAMVKLSNLSPLTGSSGQIRTNCRRTN
nr:cationic peroxidase 1-like [Tanacetum cinerariifolium]